jgi:hypothetical protein
MLADQPPIVSLDAPTYASDRSLGRAVRLRWGGVAIARYTLQARRNANVGTRWRTIAASTTSTHAVFRGRPGRTYLFRLRGRDSAGRLTAFRYDSTTVPLDDPLRFGRPVRRRRAWGGGLMRATRPGTTASRAFFGSRLALIARRTPRGASVAVTIDGRTRVVSLRGPDRFRRVVLRSRLLRPGFHTLRVTTTTRGIADLDAVGVEAGPAPPG